jgi:AAA15 family ATPase/GTPase
MIHKIEISNFKNFGDFQEILLSSESDQYPFSVVVGKNGSG